MPAAFLIRMCWMCCWHERLLPVDCVSTWLNSHDQLYRDSTGRASHPQPACQNPSRCMQNNCQAVMSICRAPSIWCSIEKHRKPLPKGVSDIRDAIEMRQVRAGKCTRPPHVIQPKHRLHTSAGRQHMAGQWRSCVSR